MGIGTISASQPLDVNGNVRLRGGLYDTNNSSGASNNVLSSNGSGGWSWQPVTSVGAISGVTISDDTSTNALRYLLFTSATSGIVGTENVSSTKLTYNPSSGSLGINTSTPTQPLDVNGNVRLRGGLYDSGNSSGGSNTVLTSNGSGGWSWQSVSAIGGSNIIIDATDTADASRFLVFTKISSGSTATEYVSTTGLVFNPSSGNLGIGSTLPSQKLDIIGNVKVSGIVTATTFSGSGSQLTGIVASYATNAGLSTNVKGTASRVLYNSGTDTTTTSANLTFNGTILGIGETAQIKRIIPSLENSFIAGTGAGANISGGPGQPGYNNILGFGAGATITCGAAGAAGYNNIFGYGAGASIIVGSGADCGYNNIMGYGSGASFSGGPGTVGYNNIFGYQSGVSLQTGSGTVCGFNNFIGFQVAKVNTVSSGYHNAIGYQAGYNLSSGTGNNLLGYQAGLNITSGSYNIAIGYAAANTNVTTGSGNVVIGYNRCVPTSGGSNQLVIGSGSNDWIVGNSSYNVGIGTSIPTQKLHVVGNILASGTVTATSLGVGETAQIKRIIPSLENSFIAGAGAGVNLSPGSISNVGYNNIIGANAGVNISNGNISESGYNNIIGVGAGTTITAGNASTVGYNNIIGVGAGTTITTGNSSSAGYNNIMGYGSGASITAGNVSSSGYNNIIGHQSGVTINTGNSSTNGYNNFIGFQVANVNTVSSGYHNAIGYQAGNKLSSGTGNNLFGYQAGLNVTSGSYNVAIGYSAANTNVTTGSGNVVIGYNRCVPISGGSNQLVIGSGSNDWINGNSSYNVGIGTTTPTEKLHVIGNILASGTVTQNSDITLKTNVQTIENALEKVLSLRGVEFDYKENGKHSLGFIAQEVEKVVPDLVFGDDLKSVAYQNFVALLVEAIKELKEEVKTLKNIINNGLGGKK